MALRIERWGVGAADILLIAGVVSILAALAAPALRVRSERRTIEDAIASVEAMRVAAAELGAGAQGLPTADSAGSLPPTLAAAAPDAAAGLGETYRLRWARWNVVDHVPAPPSVVTATPGDAPPEPTEPMLVPVVRRVGALVVHSQDDALLAGLLRRYEADGAFVRDSIWTLVLARPAGG
jgi:hypothetical protein